MNKSHTTDLIADRTPEFQQFPGLALGLDGWILRSVPKDLRFQFLRGYEKLLRIIFHPDRYQDQAKKASREAFLQTVSETVRFMCSDDFSFDITADEVPTRKNPFVQMREAVDIRDQIISTTNVTVEQIRKDMAAAQAELAKWRKRFHEEVDKSGKRETSETLLREVISRMVKEFPVPIMCQKHSATGRFFDLSRKAVPFWTQLDIFSSKNYCTAKTRWYASGEWIIQAEPMLEPAETVQFSKSYVENTHDRICGAMSLPHLCEFIRVWRAQKPNGTARKAIEELLARPHEVDPNRSIWRVSTQPFLIPFYKARSLLLLEKSKVLRLFLVDQSDYAKAPNEALLAGLEREIEFLKHQAILDEKKHNTQIELLRHRLHNTQDELESLKTKARKEKEAKELEREIEKEPQGAGDPIPVKPRRAKKQRR